MSLAFVLHPFHLANKRKAVEEIKRSGANKLVIFINWGDLDLENPSLKLGEFDELCDLAAELSLKMIFRLQCGKTRYYDDSGKVLAPPPQKEYPKQFNSTLAISGDRLGTHIEQPILTEHGLLIANSYYKAAVEYFGKRYGSNIHSYALAISNENEIKISQRKYSFSPYDENIRSFFRFHLRDDVPLINSPRKAFSPHKVRPIKNFTYYMNYRAGLLIDRVKMLSNTIRKNGGKTMGMFGQFFQSHDAIFCNNVIAELPDYLDYITVDYNFYNGYQQIYHDIHKPALMANYAKNCGYKNIFIGLYLERCRTPNQAGKTNRLAPVEQQVAERALKGVALACNQAHTDFSGYEIAGFGAGLDDFKRLNNAFEALRSTNVTSMSTNSFSVAILATHSTFDFFVADHLDTKESLLRNGLSECFKDFTSLGFNVSVVSDKLLENGRIDIDNFEAIVIPSQKSISDTLLGILSSYRGKVIQDFGFARLDKDGNYRPAAKSGLTKQLGNVKTMRMPQEISCDGFRYILDYKFTGKDFSIPGYISLFQGIQGVCTTEQGFHLIIEYDNSIQLAIAPWLLKDIETKNFLYKKLLNLLPGAGQFKGLGS